MTKFGVQFRSVIPNLTLCLYESILFPWEMFEMYFYRGGKIKERLCRPSKKRCETAWQRLLKPGKLEKEWVRALWRPFHNYRMQPPHFYKWGLWDPEEFSDLLEVWPKDGGKRARKYKQHKNVTSSFMPLCLCPSGFLIWISLPIHLGTRLKCQVLYKTFHHFSR